MASTIAIPVTFRPGNTVQTTRVPEPDSVSRTPMMLARMLSQRWLT